MTKPPYRGPGRSGIAHNDDDDNGATGATGPHASPTHSRGATGATGAEASAGGGGIMGGLTRLDTAISAASGLKGQPEGSGLHALLSLLATQFMGVPAQGFAPAPSSHQGPTGSTGATGATGAKGQDDDE